MKRSYLILVLCGAIFAASCAGEKSLVAVGRHYQSHVDGRSLKKAVRQIPLGSDTALVRKILGEPIDFGFDYRYTIDRRGRKGCILGAVFHIDEQGKIDQKWFGEICE
ncbi:MAG: hypothetical protein IPH16_09455 [Haliscomenobacter sp.]|nr:hypothetical protein [Haliscomenobacter sp.]MBK7476600.1 hypothetical protein [Haliscomenobacter sp.]